MTHTQTQGADGAGTKTAGEDARACTCHPDDNPPVPCASRYALSECRAATPAPAATPGVPDSLRVLSEAATEGAWVFERMHDDFVGVYSDDRTGSVIANFAGFHAAPRPKAEQDANARFAAEAVNHVRALIAAQPAGQAGDAGADGWRVVRAVMHKLSSAKNAGGIEDPETCAQVLGNAVDAGVAMCREALAHRQNAPAPNSTRTGAAETEDAADLIRQVDAILRKPPEPVSHPSEAWCDDYADWHDAYAVARSKALAARPEAPSDAGWSREDLEAFVAREWPEGRSAGAAARELVRALGVRGLAPTLQRLLTDLLGQINFASTDRAQILADFANAAPEAARMAKIDSFERWNPRVFDPTPPTDPAPSGQAEG